MVHVATAEAQKYPFELLLRSEVKHLSDAATNEFLFVIDFSVRHLETLSTGGVSLFLSNINIYVS